MLGRKYSFYWLNTHQPYVESILNDWHWNECWCWAGSILSAGLTLTNFMLNLSWMIDIEMSADVGQEVFSLLGWTLTNLMLNLSWMIDIEMSADVGQEVFFLLGWTLTNLMLFSDESCFHFRNADGQLRVWCKSGEGHHIDCLVQTNRVSWCGAGSVIITKQHSMFAVAEWMPFTTRITSCEIMLSPFFHQHQDMHTFQQDNTQTHFSKPTPKDKQHMLQQSIQQ